MNIPANAAIHIRPLPKIWQPEEPKCPCPGPRAKDPDRWPTGTKKLPTLPDPFPMPKDRWPTGTKKLPKLGGDPFPKQVPSCHPPKGWPVLQEPNLTPIERMKLMLDGAAQAAGRFLTGK